MIKEIDEKQKESNFNQLIKKINHRYIILESVQPMGKDYHAKKSKELVKMIEKIFEQTRKPATNKFALSIAKNLKKARARKKVDKKEIEKELTDRIKTAQEMTKEDESWGGDFYACLEYAIVNGGGMLATLVSKGLEKAKTCIFQ